MRARELWFPRNGGDTGPGEATQPGSASPLGRGPCARGTGCWRQRGSYLPQQVGMVLHQLIVLLLQLAVALLIGLGFP